MADIHTLPTSLSLQPGARAETIELLRELLQRAEDGEVQGMLYALSKGGGKFGDIGIAGELTGLPAPALALASRLTYLINRRMDKWMSQSKA